VCSRRAHEKRGPDESRVPPRPPPPPPPPRRCRACRISGAVRFVPRNSPTTFPSPPREIWTHPAGGTGGERGMVGGRSSPSSSPPLPHPTPPLTKPSELFSRVPDLAGEGLLPAGRLLRAARRGCRAPVVLALESEGRVAGREPEGVPEPCPPSARASAPHLLLRAVAARRIKVVRSRTQSRGGLPRAVVVIRSLVNNIIPSPTRGHCINEEERRNHESHACGPAALHCGWPHAGCGHGRGVRAKDLTALRFENLRAVQTRYPPVPPSPLPPSTGRSP
jgi:hypothetical protein